MKWSLFVDMVASCDALDHGVAQRRMQMRIGSDHIAGVTRVTPAWIGHEPASLADQQHSTRDIPALQSQFPEAVVAAGRNPGEIERRRAEPADACDLRHQLPKRAGKG